MAHAPHTMWACGPEGEWCSESGVRVRNGPPSRATHADAAKRREIPRPRPPPHTPPPPSPHLGSWPSCGAPPSRAAARAACAWAGCEQQQQRARGESRWEGGEQCVFLYPLCAAARRPGGRGWPTTAHTHQGRRLWMCSAASKCDGMGGERPGGAAAGKQWRRECFIYIEDLIFFLPRLFEFQKKGGRAGGHGRTRHQHSGGNGQHTHTHTHTHTHIRLHRSRRVRRARPPEPPISHLMGPSHPMHPLSIHAPSRPPPPPSAQLDALHDDVVLVRLRVEGRARLGRPQPHQQVRDVDLIVRA